MPLVLFISRTKQNKSRQTVSLSLCYLTLVVIGFIAYTSCPANIFGSKVAAFPLPVFSVATP
jgi:hypothetical protein